MYNFYIRVTADGGSQDILPTAGSPYVLDVGCTSEASVGFTDSGSPFNQVGNTKSVGDATSNVYTFVNPTIARAWCTITANEALDSDGSTLSTKVTCGGQVC